MTANSDLLRVGGLLTGEKVEITDKFVVWSDVYSKHGFRVPKNLITAITVERGSGWGRSTLRVIGQGAELANVPRLPNSMAEQAQAWLMEKLGL